MPELYLASVHAARYEVNEGADDYSAPEENRVVG